MRSHIFMRSLFAILKKEFAQIKRDKISLRLLFILPILQTLVLGYALSRDVKNISFGVVDLDHSAESAEVAEHMSHNARFTRHTTFARIEDAREALLRGQILLTIIIPKGFSEDVERAMPTEDDPESGTPAKVQILVDGQDAATSATGAGYAESILQAWGTQQLVKHLEAQGIEVQSITPLEIHDRILFNPELEYSWYMVPGMVVLLVTMVTALLTSFSLVRERENGTLEQLMVTPVSPSAVLLGKAIPYWILGQIDFILALTITGLWFGVPLTRANPLGLLLGISLFALTCVSLGIVVSTAVQSQQQALFMIWFFLIFFILTSGFMLPFESMPMWMQSVTEFNAVRHFLYIVRALILRGAPAISLWPEYAKLAFIGGMLFLTSVVLFKRKSS